MLKDCLACLNAAHSAVISACMPCTVCSSSVTGIQFLRLSMSVILMVLSVILMVLSVTVRSVVGVLVVVMSVLVKSVVTVSMVVVSVVAVAALVAIVELLVVSVDYGQLWQHQR